VKEIGVHSNTFILNNLLSSSLFYVFINMQL
jgi:hypothetical protein